MGTEIVLRLTAMGDALLAVPAVRFLNKKPQEVAWVLSNRWQALSPFLPARVIGYDGFSSILRTARQLRSLKPDRVHDLQGKFDTYLLAHLIGAPTSRYKKRSWSETFPVARGEYPLRFSDERPVWRKYLETVGGGLDEGSPISLEAAIDIPSPWLDKSRWFLENQNLRPYSFYVMHPGASHPGKVLPESGLEAFFHRTDKPVALIGDDPRPLPGISLLDWRNRLPLELLPGILRLSAGVITSDSGPMHMARAVNAPTVAVFLQTDPSLGFSPIPGPNVMVVSRTLPCKPCSLHGQRALCPEGHWNCRELAWEPIASETMAFLQKHRPS